MKNIYMLVIAEQSTTLPENYLPKPGDCSSGNSREYQGNFLAIALAVKLFLCLEVRHIFVLSRAKEISIGTTEGE